MVSIVKTPRTVSVGTDMVKDSPCTVAPGTLKCVPSFAVDLDVAVNVTSIAAPETTLWSISMLVVTDAPVPSNTYYRQSYVYHHTFLPYN